MKKEAKPFVKWAGGKGQLIPRIDQLMSVAYNKAEIDTYVEPFVGGGAVLFWVLSQHQNIKHAVINDINKDLTTAYMVVRDNLKDLKTALSELQTEYLSKNEVDRATFFLNIRDKFNKKDLSPVENTACFIFLNKTCFNGLYRVNSKGKFNVPFGKYLNPTICDEANLAACSNLLQNVDILCGDFSKTIEYANQNSLFYFDPPYKPLSKTSSFTSYAAGAFDDEEQIRLRDYCQQINDAEGLFILSNSDVRQADSANSFFDDLYDAFKIHRVSASRMINSVATKRGNVSELLICNYE